MSIIDVTGAWKVILQDATAIIHWQYLTISNGDSIYYTEKLITLSYSN